MKKLSTIALILLGSMATLATVYAFDVVKTFPDVDYGDPDTYYGEALGNMVRKGVISGYKDGNFGPNDAVTRAQLVTILDRYDMDVSNMKAIVCNGGIDRAELYPGLEVTYDTLCIE